ncbi:MAG: class I SAM-dependent methyltransferase [Candidatus Polarisedimenticolaceae bacterium]|nr:class I SAM-dependent methyltransferase [Candidatus Polarisedimenticolaceae bacterium]
MNIEKLRNEDNQIWLNVASSVHVLEYFVNLDNHLFIRFSKLYPLLKNLIPTKYHAMFEAYVKAGNRAQLIKHDCRKNLPFPTESVDHILCSHFLEHVFPDEMELIVADFYRVLKRGATLHVIVPDLALVAKEYLEKQETGSVTAADKFINDTLLSREQRGTMKYRFLEFIGGFGLQHYWMYDAASLTARLTKIGFEVVQENCSPSKTYRLDDGSLHLLVQKPN